MIDYIKDPSWENFGKIITGIGVALLGLALIIGNVPLAIAAAITIILGLIIKNWDKISTFLQNGIDWLKGKMDWVRDKFGAWGEYLYTLFLGVAQNLLNYFNDIFGGLKNILDGVIKFIKGIFTGDFKGAFEGLKQIVKGILAIVLSTFKLVFSTIVTFIQAKFNAVVGFFKGIINTILNLFKKLGGKVGDTISKAFKSVINGVLGAVEGILNSPINAINGLIDTVNQLPGVSIGRLSTFSLPRLKSGAIINIPNKGGLVGGGRAIAGESGAEGILPLTDAQAMETLGEIIGRNVVVNLTNITELDGRRLDRKMQTIRADRNFAYNG